MDTSNNDIWWIPITSKLRLCLGALTGQITPTHHGDSETMCNIYNWYIESRSCNITAVCGMCGSPSLAGLGQHWPPAVGQQYPHVPLVLQCKGQSSLTECIVMCVLCVCVCGGGDICVCVCV